MKRLFIILLVVFSYSAYSQERLIENTTISEYFGQIDNELFFIQENASDDYELWKTDGTTNGTAKVFTFSSESYLLYLATLNNKILFRCDDGTHGEELWITDGTTNNTKLLKDINPGSASSGPSSTSQDGIYNGKLYFEANDGVNGNEIWETNGTSSGTVMVKNIATGAFSSNPRSFTVANNLLFFEATGDNSGSELWVTNGTEEDTRLVKDIHPGGFNSYPMHLTKYGNKLIFSATDGTSHGREVWITDGTTANTNLIKDINSTSSGSIYSGTCPFVAFNSKVYFFANDGTNGYELWSTNGTSDGTSMVKNVNPGSASSENTTSRIVKLNNNKLIVTLKDGTHGQEPWILDATTGNLTLLKDITNGTSTKLYLDKSVVINDKIYFAGNDNMQYYEELWVSDGTTSGTKMLIDMVPGNFSSYPHNFNKLGDTLVFSATDPDQHRHLYAYNTLSPLKPLLNVIDGTGSGFYDVGNTVTISAVPPRDNKLFDRWIGDVSSLSDTLQSPITFLMPDENINITAEFVRGSELTIENGTGSGLYKPSQIVQITSVLPPEGKIFDKWSTGYEHLLTDVNAASTTITLPGYSTNITVTALFKDAPIDTFTLIVNNGTGSNNYLAGDEVHISANEPPENMVFDKWSGDTNTIIDIYSSTTTLIMPEKNIDISPIYQDTSNAQNEILHVIASDDLFKVFPNPAKNYINIVSETCIDMIDIKNMHGEIIKIIKDPMHYRYIDVSNLKTGMYFISFKNKNMYSTQKLIIH